MHCVAHQLSNCPSIISGEPLPLFDLLLPRRPSDVTEPEPDWEVGPTLNAS